MALEVTYRPLSALKPFAKNARTHSRRQIAQIVESIQRFGFNNPILIDEDGEIVAGHGRAMAAKEVELELVPTIVIRGLSDAQKRAFRLADNKIALNASWDEALLREELEAILAIEADLDFDVTATGFETGEIDVLLGPAAAPDADDEVPPVEDDLPSISQPGDLWAFGPHRLLCGDARDAESYSKLLEGAVADMVFTDPPYNVPIDGHVTGHGRYRHKNFAMASGEMSKAEFTTFLAQSIGAMVNASADGAVHFVCMDWRHLDDVLAAAQPLYSEWLNLCVWNKSNAGMGSLYRSKHELVLVFKVGRRPHINNVSLGRLGRHRSNVWDYAGATSFGRDRNKTLAMHPTVKPVGMVADAIRDCSNRGDRVLDGFCGSGTTLIAAERAGRVVYGMEIDPHYVDVAIRRWIQTFKSEPVLLGTSEAWPAVETRRLNSVAA